MNSPVAIVYAKTSYYAHINPHRPSFLPFCKAIFQPARSFRLALSPVFSSNCLTLTCRATKMPNPHKSPTKDQPAHKLKLGALSAAIWKTDTAKGPVFNVTFQRSYRDGEEWRTSGSFGRNNLLPLGLLAGRAFEWITNQSSTPSRQ